MRNLPPEIREESSSRTCSDIDVLYPSLYENDRDVEDRLSTATDNILETVPGPQELSDMLRFIQNQLIGHVNKITKSVWYRNLKMHLL